MSPKHVCVAMSGGVDSAGAALLLQRLGYKVSGVTLRLHAYKDRPGLCGSADDIETARAVAARLGISHTVLDLSNLFQTAVMDRWGSSNTTWMRPPGKGSATAEASRWLYRVLAVTDMGAVSSGMEIQLIRSAVSSRVKRSLLGPRMTLPVSSSFRSTYSGVSALTPNPLRWPVV